MSDYVVKKFPDISTYTTTWRMTDPATGRSADAVVSEILLRDAKYNIESYIMRELENRLFYGPEPQRAEPSRRDKIHAILQEARVRP